MRHLVPNDFFGVIDEVFGLPARMQKSNPVGVIKVDVKESSDRYTLLADLPGVPKENVKIKFEQGHLTISVQEQSQNEQKEGEKFLRLERFSSLRSRSFYFGDNVDDGQIKASYKDGVLSLEIPKLKPVLEVREINID